MAFMNPSPKEEGIEVGTPFSFEAGRLLGKNLFYLYPWKGMGIYKGWRRQSFLIIHKSRLPSALCLLCKNPYN